MQEITLKNSKEPTLKNTLNLNDIKLIEKFESVGPSPGIEESDIKTYNLPESIPEDEELQTQSDYVIPDGTFRDNFEFPLNNRVYHKLEGILVSNQFQRRIPVQNTNFVTPRIDDDILCQEIQMDMQSTI